MRIPIQTAGALRARETSGIRPNNQGIQAQAGKTCTLIGSGTRCDPLLVGNYIVGDLVCVDVYQCAAVNDDGSIDISFEPSETSCGECTPELDSISVREVLSLPLPIRELVSAPVVSRRFFRGSL